MDLGNGQRERKIEREREREACLICELMPKRAKSSGQKSLDAMPADRSFCMPVCLLLRKEAMVAAADGAIRFPIRFRSSRGSWGIGEGGKLVMVGSRWLPRDPAAGTSEHRAVVSS